MDATGEGAAFSYFLLSDTDVAEVAAAEEAAVAAWRGEDADAARIVYRRRQDNTGFKAGNVRDFCESHGRAFDLMLPLDADSLMTGGAIVKLVRIMQAYPKLGILQSLVVGMPSPSPFARIFQFGMRMGMRSYTIAQAWWVGDCGPYWGHNAVVRIKPFVEHCTLPVLSGGPPFGGHVLSHDQVEATLMRRAGYEVRVMPVEGGSYEDNPPDVLEFIRRDVRWCQGNMQYVKLLGLPGLKPMSRFQFVWAILMFVGIPAWTLMIALLPVAAADALTICGFSCWLGEGALRDVSADVSGAKNRRVDRCGADAGRDQTLWRWVAVLLERGAGTRVLIFAGRGLDHSHVDLHGWVAIWKIDCVERTAARCRRLDVGASGASALAADDVRCDCAISVVLDFASGAVWSLPLTAGYVLAIPFAVVTASPALGRVMRRDGIAGIPEDFAAPPENRRAVRRLRPHP